MARFLFGRGLEAASAISYCRVLTDRRAHHELEDLILTGARRPRRGDVLVGDLVGVLGDLVVQHRQRLSEACVVKRGAAQSAGRPAVSFEDPRDQRLASTWRRLRKIRLLELSEFIGNSRIPGPSTAM